MFALLWFLPLNNFTDLSFLLLPLGSKISAQCIRALI